MILLIANREITKIFSNLFTLKKINCQRRQQKILPINMYYCKICRNRKSVKLNKYLKFRLLFHIIIRQNFLPFRICKFLNKFSQKLIPYSEIRLFFWTHYWIYNKMQFKIILYTRSLCSKHFIAIWKEKKINLNFRPSILRNFQKSSKQKIRKNFSSF